MNTVKYSASTLVHWKGTDYEIVFVKFMTVYFSQRDGACFNSGFVTFEPLWRPVNKNIIWSFRHTSIWQLFVLDQGCGREASTRLVPRQFVTGIIASKLKGK
jgi:hypothetical protein